MRQINCKLNTNLSLKKGHTLLTFPFLPRNSWRNFIFEIKKELIINREDLIDADFIDDFSTFGTMLFMLDRLDNFNSTNIAQRSKKSRLIVYNNTLNILEYFFNVESNNVTITHLSFLEIVLKNLEDEDLKRFIDSQWFKCLTNLFIDFFIELQHSCYSKMISIIESFEEHNFKYIITFESDDFNVAEKKISSEINSYRNNLINLIQAELFSYIPKHELIISFDSISESNRIADLVKKIQGIQLATGFPASIEISNSNKNSPVFRRKRLFQYFGFPSDYSYFIYKNQKINFKGGANGKDATVVRQLAQEYIDNNNEGLAVESILKGSSTHWPSIFRDYVLNNVKVPKDYLFKKSGKVVSLNLPTDLDPQG